MLEDSLVKVPPFSVVFASKAEQLSVVDTGVDLLKLKFECLAQIEIRSQSNGILMW